MSNMHETPSPMVTTGASTRSGGKRRTTAAAVTSATKPRVTRRELKKLTEMDLEEKDDIPTATPVKAFGENSSRAAVTPSSLHDDFVNLMKAQGLEKMATEAGLMKDGALVDIKQEPGLESAPFQGTPNGKRPLSAIKAEMGSPSFSSPSSAKKRKYMKINKGLRHFSMKVCEKVEEKNVTTYNEVADELVREFVTLRPNDSGYDEKNIRRRVYDALNVLMAMDIISKERKEIRWKGLPTNLQHDAEMLIAERNERMKSVEQKRQHLQDLLVQQVAMKNLLKRNTKRRKENGTDTLRDEGRIFLPFIVVNTNKDTVIQCEMSEDRQDIFFNFSNPFEINDDTEILRRLDLHKCPYGELKQIVPDKLMSYLPAECESKSDES
ncbi:hypothetical protein Poli38472_005521 [Pythium oligandrum]|uniref:Transcription factor Dp-1 n=1 Tax=Pythium oligandrum TaxID=41045 RepID=A0A8K1CI48_PYTOL|nr:hypothetical protein Poli38472_005521 [Pythium oligandrum]|eukprot:TMW62903.1 hypothetical protein Poli38472_005521 [Pythium oligandrum]